MPTPEVKITAVSVVFVGKFLPQIFHPAWFAAKKLIPQQEADNAKVDVMTSDVAIVTTEWLRLTVTQDRFGATTTKEDSIPLLRDLAIGTLHFFPETPLQAMGINRDTHFDMASEADWHAVGHRIAPKEPWNGLLEKPGMLTVRMQGYKTGSLKGNVNVTVEPSIKVKPHGVFVQVNDHYTFEDATPVAKVVEVLRAEFMSSLERSAKIANRLVTL